MSVLQVIQRGFNAFGYHIRRVEDGSSVTDPYAEQTRLLSGQKVATVVEIGAADGRDVISYARQYPDARIFSYEPLPDSFAKLQAGTAALGNVKCVQAAVSDQTGQATFYQTVLSDASSLFPSHATGSTYDKYTRPAGEITVDTITLQDIAEREGLSHIDLLKMDAQGAELKIMQGGKSLLEQGAIDLIYTEISFLDHFNGGVRFDELMSYICSFGYRFHNLYGLVHNQKGQLAWGDAIFVHPRLWR